MMSYAFLALLVVAVSSLRPPAVTDGVALVVVKDFLSLNNAGETVRFLEFPRYTPAIDDDQFVLARWFHAIGDDGREIDVEAIGVEPDPAGNLIVTLRLDRLDTGSYATVTITHVVARRERPLPNGPCPIPPTEAYPEDVRPYLWPTAMVASQHPDVKAAAEQFRAQTDDALELARLLAEAMRTRSYMSKGDDPTLPTSAKVWRYGGSCCGSAVCAAAILRAAGVPAQVTYCPAGYVHGILRFYVQDHGWIRMDATCGSARFPLVQEPADRGMVRLYDAPIEMERLWYAYAWPWHNNTLDGDYVFRSQGRPVDRVRFAARDEAEAAARGGVSGWVQEPFEHLEPGSWNHVLSVEAWRLDGVAWESISAASRREALSRRSGLFATTMSECERALGTRWPPGALATVVDFGHIPVVE